MSKIRLNKNGNSIKVNIDKKISYGAINKCLNQDSNISDNERKIILGCILKYDPNVINENKKIDKLEINIIYTNDGYYEIIKKDANNYIISKKNIIKDTILETQIEVKNNTYRIDNMRHVNYSTMDIKTYNSSNPNKENKQIALNSAKKLLDNAIDNNMINSIIDVNKLYQKLNLIKKDNDNIIIKDDVVSLCTRKKENDINNKKQCNFNIVLNDTKEVVGDISYNYYEDGPSSLGNVIYNVKKEYRHNHYCTRALALLKKLLKNNNYKGDKSLYLATINEYSIKVAKNNGAKLYDGAFVDDKQEDYIDVFDDRLNEDDKTTLFKINL